MRRVVGLIIADRTVMAVIVLNAVALFLGRMVPEGSPGNLFWLQVDYVCVVFFLVEALLKIGRSGWPDYWSSNWNRFDLTVVVLSLPALMAPVIDLQDFAFVLVLRLGRLFRLFRVLRFIPNLEHLALGVRRALRASIGVLLALALVNFILAMGATFLFGEVDPELFGNPIRSCYSMFRVFTVEGWHEIPDRLAERAMVAGVELSPTAIVAGARLYFMIAVVIGGILGLSLANAVFVDEMMMDNTQQLEDKVDRLTEEVRALREELSGRAPPQGR